MYRMSNERIGCTLADAAATPAYMDYLAEASTSSPSLHVVYINTSLETKANAHELVPTITCTSSNVVQTILQVRLVTASFIASAVCLFRWGCIFFLLINASQMCFFFLQAFAEVPNLKIWYGPDAYMGANIMELFQQMTVMTDEEIAEIHPAHNRASIKSLLPRLHYYQVDFGFET